MEPIRVELEIFKNLLSEFYVEVTEFRWPEFEQIAADAGKGPNSCLPPGSPLIGVYIHVNNIKYCYNPNPYSVRGINYGFSDNYDELFTELDHNIKIPISIDLLSDYIKDLKQEIINLDSKIISKNITVEGKKLQIFTARNLELVIKVDSEYYQDYIQAEIHDLLLDLKKTNQRFLIKIDNLIKGKKRKNDIKISTKKPSVMSIR